MGKIFKRSITAVAVIVVAAAAAGVAVFMGVGRGPGVDGELALPGLTDKVRVLRDEHGIPYIFAANTPDLIRAQGFVTAQDRIFQMEGYRAIATGRLAEAVGESGLANDRQIRLIGLTRNAARHARLLSPEARQFLGWYAEGMNAYINGHAGDLPVELKLAGFTARPWTLDDMVTVLHYVNWSQAANVKAELVMQALIDKFGADKAGSELVPVNVNPDRQVKPIVVGSTGDGARLGLQDHHLLADLAAGGSSAPIAVGSNNWAIGRTPLGQRRGRARQRPASGQPHAARHLASDRAVHAPDPGRGCRPARPCPAFPSAAPLTWPSA